MDIWKKYALLICSIYFLISTGHAASNLYDLFYFLYTILRIVSVISYSLLRKLALFNLTSRSVTNYKLYCSVKYLDV